MGQIIADIDRNGREIIRIEVSEFKGKELINLRIWFQATPESPYRPTQKGVALDISKYEDLKLAIDKIGEFIKDKDADVVPELNNERVSEVSVKDLTEESSEGDEASEKPEEE